MKGDELSVVCVVQSGDFRDFWSPFSTSVNVSS